MSEQLHVEERPNNSHVERDVDQVIVHTGNQNVLLLVRRELEESLGEVVAKAVDHELGKVGIDLSEDHVSVLGVAFLKLALQESAAMLVFA